MWTWRQVSAPTLSACWPWAGPFSSIQLDTRAKPLGIGKYHAGHSQAIGNLCQSNAKLNSTQVGGEPFCDFHSKTSEFIKGAASLDADGPLSIVIMKTVLPMLSPMRDNLKLFDDANTQAGVKRAMSSKFTRWKCLLLVYTGFIIIFLWWHKNVNTFTHG